MSAITLWYLKFWNSALKSKKLPPGILMNLFDGEFTSLKSSPRGHQILRWISDSKLAAISRMFLECYPLRVLSPYIINLGFFFDRIVEYSFALKDIRFRAGDISLDIGSGYSCFSTYLAYVSSSVSIDLNRNTLIFQKKTAETMGKEISRKFECVRADSTRLPFCDNALDHVFAISTIEHIRTDYIVAKECGRVLQRNGIFFLSLPFSEPPRENQVSPFFQRFYTAEMISERIVKPSMLSSERLNFSSPFLRTLPQGWFILKDLLLATARSSEAERTRSRIKEALVLIMLRKH
jgi:SAM-dependent methyltransferase